MVVLAARHGRRVVRCVLACSLPVIATAAVLTQPANAPEDTLVLANHVLAMEGLVGATVEQAVLRAIYLEFEARAQLLARAAGAPLFYTREESAAFSRTTAVAHAWEYYVEKVRRLERGGR